MNSLCRALIQYASSPSSRQRLLFHPTIFILQSYSTAAATRSKYKPLQTSSIPQPPTNIDDIERPREIPFQPKISNSVNLIGLVHKPVHFQTSADGRTWAGTIITREQSSDCPSLLIPIVFEGDLAHIAACHLKEKDCIHVDGQLSADLSYLDTKQAQDNLQIVVSSLNFVQGYSQIQNISALHKQEESFSSSVASEKHDIKQSWKDLLKKTNVKQDVIDIDKAWKDLLSKPDEWWDIQSSEEKAKGAAFKRKKNGELLFIDNSTPKWIQEKLELITFDRRCDPINWKNGAKKTVVSVLSSWRDLIDHPKQWWDFRDNKVNPKYPDFKSKDGDLALWLDKAPRWVLSKLEEIEFDVQIVKSKQASECGAKKTVVSVFSLWRDLIDHPKQWWDFRDNKVNPKYPDFKSKDGDLALWLDKAPRWVLSKLEEIEFDVQIVKSKQASECGAKKTVVSVLSSWRDLIDHPKQWLDFRDNKVNPKYPDFKSKDGNLVLWLDKAPQWVLSKLDEIEFDVQIVKSKQASECGTKKTVVSVLSSWRDLIDHPKQWWDCRGKKVNPKYPDFKSKDGNLALWLDKAPQLVLSKLDEIEFDVQIVKSKQASECGTKKTVVSVLSSWRDLIDHPKQWWDCRGKKVNPKYPDFKSKDGNLALWLDKAPQLVLSKLEGIEFDIQIVKSEQGKECKSDESWRNLVENPDKWWDNRLGKLKERSPDFKHKETQEALWLSDSPSWVMSKLPPIKPEHSVETGNRQALFSSTLEEKVDKITEF